MCHSTTTKNRQAIFTFLDMQQFSLFRVLGQGSFATVKLAERKSDGTKWAIKIIRKTSLGKGDEEALKTEVTILEVGGREPPSLELYHIARPSLACT